MNQLTGCYASVRPYQAFTLHWIADCTTPRAAAFKADTGSCSHRQWSERPGHSGFPPRRAFISMQMHSALQFVIFTRQPTLTNLSTFAHICPRGKSSLKVAAWFALYLVFCTVHLHVCLRLTVGFLGPPIQQEHFAHLQIQLPTSVPTASDATYHAPRRLSVRSRRLLMK